MFDLHSHVLPYLDDGAKDEQISLEMLREAKRQGVDVVAATPHCFAKNQEAVDKLIEKRNESYSKMMSLMGDSELYPHLVLGAEVNLCTDISEFSNLSQLCYQNTNYILLELNGESSPSDISEWVYNISIKGYRPVIAHIDRYELYRDIMDELSHLDVIYQVNAARFLTMSDRRILKNVFKRHNKFFASSDMHNLTTRVCNIEQAKRVADKKFKKISEMLFNEGARMIVENKDFVPVL